MIMDDLVVLKMLFCLYGWVIVGNVVGFNDGVMVCLFVLVDIVVELGLMVCMCLVGYFFVGVEFEVMGIGLVLVIEKVFK